MFRFLLRYISFTLFPVLFLLSCDQPETGGKVIAEVGDKRLYQADLDAVVQPGTEKNDSALMAEDFIKKWIKQELLIRKAEENLSTEQKNVTRELQEYRNSLITYKYKNALMKQRMDTLVTKDQIEEYYLENPENFNLTKNIVKAIFLKVPTEFANPAQLKRLCANTSREGLNELREYCLQYAKGFDIFMDNWVDFETMMKNIPTEIADPEVYLTRNNQLEMNDNEYYYLVCIQDYRLKNSQAPIEFVEENIKNLILNRRKIEFLKQVEDNVYTEAVRNNLFKIYNTDNE